MADGLGGPLEGITILELGSLIAGPFCARLLGDMGARVIKVESPTLGDPLRQWGRVTAESGSLWWLVQARNKESVVADLRTPGGQEIVRRLVPKADIVVENFRPGKLEEWGLGPDELRRCREDLIIVRISGFGQNGPWRERPGFGSVAEALGGIRHLTGEPNGPPMRVGLSIADAVAGIYGALGACAALYRRHEKRVGDVVDVALTDSVLSLLESILPEYGSERLVRNRSGNTLSGAAPSNTYLTKDQQWIAIGANGDSIFRRLAVLMNIPGLPDDPRFADNQARCAHVAILDEVIGTWVSRQDLDGLWERLITAGVPAAPIHDVAQIVANPQFRARGMLQEVDVPHLGAVLMPGMVPQFKSGDGSIRWAGPSLGEHTREVLLNDAGFSEDELANVDPPCPRCRDSVKCTPVTVLTTVMRMEQRAPSVRYTASDTAPAQPASGNATDNSGRGIRRALQILSLINSNGPSLTIAEIVARADLPKTTTMRLVRLLRREGLLYSTSDGRVAPGPVLLGLGEVASRQWRVTPITESVLDALAGATQETASIFVMTQGSRVCVARAEGPQPVRHIQAIGERYPLWSGATGLILLSDKPKSVIDRVLRTAPTGFEADALRAAIREARKLSVATSHGTREPGLSALAVPVLDASCEVVASVSVSGPTDRFTQASMQMFGEAAARAAVELSEYYVRHSLFGSSIDRSSGKARHTGPSKEPHKQATHAVRPGLGPAKLP